MNQNLNEFATGTKNAAIFKTNAPFSNQYQGNSPRWLFVCSAGLLRSPTGAAVAVKNGINARSAGSNPNYALIPVSANLINWAERIVFVNAANYLDSLDVFVGMDDLCDQIRAKSYIMDIPDIYDYNDPHLVRMFEQEFLWF
jgi:predicted protein tyrosine phosphatase